MLRVEFAHGLGSFIASREDGMDARRPEWTIVLRLDFLPDSGPELHLSDSANPEDVHAIHLQAVIRLVPLLTDAGSRTFST